jgi:membrane fusion protein (multidrug efflux system)
MYVRVRVEQGVDENAMTVPQQAVQRGNAGEASLLVVGAENKVVSKPVKTGATLGDRWIISSGIEPNEVVIVDGFQKLRPGAVVKPIPWKPTGTGAAAAPAAAAPAGQKP